MREYVVETVNELKETIYKGRYKTVIFDFDGTLVETVYDVALCFNKALSYWGFPEWSLEDIKTLIGGDLETIVSKMIPEELRSRENINNVKQKYREIYMNDKKPHSLPYEGVNELLHDLKKEKIMIAVNSNKGQQLLDAMVKDLFGEDLFCKVVGYGERFPSKPDPYGVFQILRFCNCKAVEALYIGDGNSDEMTAKNAGMDFALVRWN